MKYAAININFDSLGEMYGFPTDFRDPCFFEVAERFFALSDKYNFKYSIYVIGKDLEKAENRAAVKAWHDRGHEIGNHSWSHANNLGSMPLEMIKNEVKLSHDIISQTIGKEVKGFIAPGWSTSGDLLKTLIDLDYDYDTSSFPSWLMYPALAKLSMNYWRDERLKKIWQRMDLGYFLFGSSRPYLSSGNLFGRHSKATDKKITVLPLPTGKMRFACWHTVGFMFGWKFHKKLLQQCLDKNESFYYLAHPADLLCKEDIAFDSKVRFERMNISLEEKMNRFEECLKIILDSGRQIVTMGELAKLHART